MLARICAGGGPIPCAKGRPYRDTRFCPVQTEGAEVSYHGNDPDSTRQVRERHARVSVITIIDGLAITIIDGRLNQVHRHPAAPLMPLTADLPRIHAGQLLLAAGRRDRLGRPLGEVPASPRLLYRGEDSLSPRAPLPPEMDGAASAARRRKRPYVARAAFRSQHTLRRGNGNGGPVTPTDALVKRRVSANAAPRQAAQKEHDN